MDTLHKLAGITSTDEPNQQPSQLIPPPQLPPIPTDPDTNPNTAHRSSLPLNRQPSHKSFRSTRNHRERSLSRENRRSLRPQSSHSHTGSATSSEEYNWGPNHPCFPHPNPHCDGKSAEATSTRVIRIRRDWLRAGDLYPQYANIYPEILDPLVTDSEFRALIAEVNERVAMTFDPRSLRARWDVVCGVLTGYVNEDMGFTGVKKGMKGLEAFLDEWNRGREVLGKEVKVVQLRRTGFMSLDFVVPDPKIEEEDLRERGMMVEGEDGEGGIGPAE